MTTTTGQPAASSVAHPAAPRRRGRSRRTALGGALIVVGAIAGFAVYDAGGNWEPVIAIARAVPFGQQVTTADLLQIALPADSGLAVVDWSQASEIVGLAATTDLFPGQLLTRDAVTAQRPPRAGQAVVGIGVKRGQLPATALAARDVVLVIDAALTAGGGVQGSVLRSTEADSAGMRTVDLLVAATDAPAVARLSKSGNAVLVLVQAG